MRFAEKLKALRQAAGLSQPELAEKAGMTRDGIAHLEQGRRLPSWESVQALCKALGVSCEAFRQAEEKPAEGAAPKRGRPKKRQG